MSKYEKLWKSIQENGSGKITLTFDEVEKILGFKIDHSFLTYKKELLDYGYCVEKISLKQKEVHFIKS